MRVLLMNAFQISLSLSLKKYCQIVAKKKAVNKWLDFTSKAHSRLIISPQKQRALIITIINYITVTN
jgi:hypothetical protein